MDIKKFNERMSRPKYSKGGYIKKLGNRKYFDDGGIAANSTAAGTNGGQLTNTNNSGVGGVAGALGLNAASANINQGTNNAQLNNAYTGSQNAINAQVGLTNTLTPGAQTGVNAQNQVEQEALAEASGAGANPAQAELLQATGQNVNQEAALLAGQRGAGANVGLAGRNIGQQGAATQQAAVGQAATLEAQQQIAEQNAAAGIGAQQIGQAQGATTALNQAQQNEQNTLQNANTSANNAAVSMQGNVNNVNSQASQGILGGIASGASSVLGAVGLNKGGEVSPHAKHKLDFVHKMTKTALEHFDEGGYTSSAPSSAPDIAAPAAPASKSGGSGIGSLAALAMDDGGKVGDDNSTPTTGSTAKTASNFFSFGTPPTEAAPAPQTLDQKNEAVRRQNSANFGHADGGVIQANPLVGAIVGQSMAPQAGGYSQSQVSGGPSISSPSASSMDLGKSISSGYKAGQKIYNNKPAQQMNAGQEQATNDFNNNYADGPAVEQDADNEYKGGSIWNVHPSHRDQYAADHFAKYFSKGGESKEVPAMVSANERYLNPSEVEMVKHGADPSKLGYKFPGKDKVPGKDSLKNDTIPATLEEGGVVIPLHIEKTKDPDKMRLFTLKSLRATGKHLKRPKGMS